MGTFRGYTRKGKGWLLITGYCILLTFALSSCGAPDPAKPDRDALHLDGIVLVIGDGMGLSKISQASLESRQPLTLESFPVTGLQKTHSLSGTITDSAAAITAMLTGYKTYNGWIGIDGRGNSRETLFELARKQNWSTGIISTSSITHATPAGAVAHWHNRKDHYRIAALMLESLPDIVIGGGRKYFLRETQPAKKSSLESKALMDLEELEQRLAGGEKAGHQLMLDYSEFMGIECGRPCPLAYVTANDEAEIESLQQPGLLALLAEDHFPPVDPDHVGRNSQKDLEPNSVAQIRDRSGFLKKAVLLSVDTFLARRRPFLMLVEGSQIDWGGHANDIRYALSELMDLDETISALIDRTRERNVLIVVTADHETGGHAILDGRPGFPQESGFLTDYHTGVWVPVFAMGPASERFAGVYDNTEIHRKLKSIMDSAGPSTGLR